MAGVAVATLEAELAGIEAELLRRSQLTRQHTILNGIPDRLANGDPFLPRLIEPHRNKALYGGRGGMKSWSFAKLVVEYCRVHPGTRVLCVREIQGSLKESVKKLIEDQIRAAGLEGDPGAGKFRITREDIRTPGHGIMVFIGMQNHTADTVKSFEGFKIMWFEESQKASQRSLDLLRPTIRMDGSELWWSWNPKSPKDPVDKLFRGPAGAPPDSVVIKVNWQDNPNFPAVLRSDLEHDRNIDPDKYAHVWLGGYEEKSEARVFKNFVVREFETRSDATFLHGADWGFSIDPSVLIRCYVEGLPAAPGQRPTLYIDGEAYAVGCEIDNTPHLFDTLGNGSARAWQIIADSARPETINYMQRHGYPRIVAARKGAGSVEEGITFLQRFNIVVHPRCVHCIDELSTYSYKVDKLTDVVVPVLEDKKNHVIDAMRYAVEKLPRGNDWVTW